MCGSHKTRGQVSSVSHTGGLDYLHCSLLVPIIVVAAGLFVVHRHAEPVDDCPCFEDAIAFVSVIMGAMLARWHFSRYVLAPLHLNGFSDYYVSRTPGASLSTPQDIAIFMFYAILKMVVGVSAIFVWRIIAKRILLAILPPIFRKFSSEVGPLPTRRWYTPATDYSTVPADAAHLRTVPSVIDLPSQVTVLKSGVLPRTHVYRMTEGNETKQRTGRGISEKKGLEMVNRQVVPGEGVVREEKVKHYDADGKLPFLIRLDAYLTPHYSPHKGCRVHGNWVNCNRRHAYFV